MIGTVRTWCDPSSATGCVSFTVIATGASGGGNYNSGTVTIDASKANTIYGNSNTVQQSAIRLIPQLRY